MPIPDDIKLVEPWAELSAARAEVFQAELQRELAPAHVLYGVEAKAVAVRNDCDDALFELIGRMEKLAVVHLTWSQRQELNPKWPTTSLFATWEDWVREGLLRDHKDFGER